MNIDQHIISFFKGKITLEEYAELKRWFNSSDENKQYFCDTILILKATAFKKEQQEFDIENAWIKLEKQQTPRPKKFKLHSMPLIAASIGLFLMVSGGLLGYLFTGSSSAEYMVYSVEAPAESRSRVTLPDGSTIMLNAGSKLEYTSVFGKKIREVTFEGEGFFDIETNESIPFRVILPDHTVEVLGTKFNIKSYQNDEQTQIALLEGSIRIQETFHANQPIYLSPAQQYKYQKQQSGYRIEPVNPSNIGAWNKGILFFDNQSLKDIVNQLERIYNCTILIKSEELQNKIFYSDFEVNQPLEKILEILSAGDKFKYSINSNHIELYN